MSNSFNHYYSLVKGRFGVFHCWPFIESLSIYTTEVMRVCIHLMWAKTALQVFGVEFLACQMAEGAS